MTPNRSQPEITAVAGRCQAIRYDVRSPSGAQLVELAGKVTHLYYFATPQIARRKSGQLDSARLDEFNTFLCNRVLRSTASLGRSDDGSTYRLLPIVSFRRNTTRWHDGIRYGKGGC